MLGWLGEPTIMHDEGDKCLSKYDPLNIKHIYVSRGDANKYKKDDDIDIQKKLASYVSNKPKCLHLA